MTINGVIYSPVWTPYKNIQGQPFGDIGFVCMITSGLSYRIMENDLDRVCTLVIKNGQIVMNVTGVYFTVL